MPKLHKLINHLGEKKFLLFAFVSLVIVTAIAAGIFILLQTKPKPVAKVDTEAKIITYSTDTPEETPPPASYTWQGASIDPKYIAMPTIGVAGYIQKVGVDQNTQIAVPDNIFMTGWFVDSVIPGSKGLSIIDGHVDGTTTGGIFRNLINIKTGDDFTIQLGDDSLKHFKVKSVQQVSNEQAAAILFSQDPNISNQLNLITCGGNYLTDQKTYDQRVIVTSELVAM